MIDDLEACVKRKIIFVIKKGNFKKQKQSQSDGKQYFVMHSILKKITEKLYK